MKRTIRMFSTLAACSLLLSCGDNWQDSLVGPWKISPDAELARETITLNFIKENGTYYPATLSYSLDATGLMKIEKGRDHAVCCFGGIDKHLTDARWEKRLSAEDQIRVRRMLARLRPQSFSKDYPFVLPEGCSFASDTRPWSGVGFSRGRVGGAFVFQSECHGAGADKAERLLRSVVAILPPVEGSAEFTERGGAGDWRAFLYDR